MALWGVLMTLYNPIEEFKKEINIIVDILTKYRHGLTISNISAYSKISRNICSKIIDLMIIEGLILCKKFGSAKVCYLLD